MLLSVVLAPLWSGCATIADSFDTPKVQLVSIQPLTNNFLEQRFALTLRLQNPNPIPLPVNGISVNLEVAGEEIATGVSPDSTVVAAYGEELIKMEVSADLLGSFIAFDHLLSAKTKSLEYRLNGKIQVDMPFISVISFDEEGSLPFN